MTSTAATSACGQGAVGAVGAAGSVGSPGSLNAPGRPEEDGARPVGGCGQEALQYPDAAEESTADGACGQEAAAAAVPLAPEGACGQRAVQSVAACGQEALRPSAAVEEPTTEGSCGQGAMAAGGDARSEGACGQAAVISAPAPPATGCGQEAAGAAPSTSASGGERRSAAAAGCGQEAVGAAEDAPSAGASDGACGQGVQQGPRLLDAYEMGAWRAFLAAAVGVTAALNHELEAGAGISMHEYEILVRLSEAPERTMRMSTLAEHVSHSRSRLTHTVGRLEKEGYVRRTSCEGDRRGVNCELTEAGYDFLRVAAPIHLAGVRRHVIERLDRAELVPFTTMLSSLVEAEG